MRLSRLLLASTLAFFLLIFISVIVMHVYNTRQDVQVQLQSHAQDAATALGLSLAQPMHQKDLVLAELVIGTAFDRGYYQDIRIVSVDGKAVLSKSLPPQVPNVPSWFVRLVPLHAPSGESFISSGWQQLGRVVVTSHPNFAYRQLWRTSTQSFYFLSGLFIFSFAMLALLLRAILRPLGDIEKAAKAVSERNFQSVLGIPKLIELRHVAEAFNDMSAKIRRIVEEESVRAGQFHHEAYQDTVTGLENRRSFDSRLAAMLNDSSVDSGVVMMLRIARFKEYNQKHGFMQGDELLKFTAEAIAKMAQGRAGIRARINGGAFAMVFSNVTAAAAAEMLSDLCVRLAQACVEQGRGDVIFACGAAHFEGKALGSALMAAADHASEIAIHAAPNSYHMVLDVGLAEAGKGSGYWRDTINHALQNEGLSLVAQPVHTVTDDKLYQHEVMARLKDEAGNAVSAGEFFPMAARHGLTSQLDRKLLLLLLDGLDVSAVPSGGIAFNVSIHSLQDEAFRTWLFQMLKQHPAEAAKVVFELAEFGIEMHEAEVRTFVAGLRAVKGRFAIDHFGLSKGALRYLHLFKPDYVKLSSSYSKGLREDQGNQFFITSLVRIARLLGIRIISQSVEDAPTRDLLKELGVDAYQGYLAGKPIPFRG